MGNKPLETWQLQVIAEGSSIHITYRSSHNSSCPNSFPPSCTCVFGRENVSQPPIATVTMRSFVGTDQSTQLSVRHLTVDNGSQDFRLQDLVEWQCHEIPIEDDEIRFLANGKRPDLLLSKRSVCSIQRHSFQRLLASEAFVRVPARDLKFY